MKGNDQADTLAGKAILTSGLLLGRSEVLRSTPLITWTKEAWKEEGARWSSLKGRERAIFDQMNIGTVSKAMLGKLLRDGGGGAHIIRAFPSA